MRGNEIDLEAAVRRNHALLLEPREYLVGSQRGVGIEQIAELNVLRRDTGPQAIACAPGRAGVQAEHLVRLLQRGMLSEDRLEMRDPVAALAGLAVGNASQAWP